MSGLNEELKNVDKKLDSARKTLFDLLGNIFSFKCKLSPVVSLHVWSIYVHPVLRSGLAALPIRPPIMRTLTSFHNKILRGILKLSSRSPLAPLYFLLGELPIEAFLHQDILILFWSIWANPQTKIHDIVKYLLMQADSSSLTWSNHLRILFKLYSLPDPLNLMNSTLWSKDRWSVMVKTSVTTYHEAAWRLKVIDNTKLNFLNIQATGLSGRPHPTISGILTTQDVTKSRIHIKMLSGDYPCYYYLGSDREKDAFCRLCHSLSPLHPPPDEDMVHLLTRCRGTLETRSRVIPELLNTIQQHFPTNSILVEQNHSHLTQLILDPTSLNLPMNMRIPPNHPALPLVLAVCRNFCLLIHKDRTTKLKKLKTKDSLTI